MVFSHRDAFWRLVERRAGLITLFIAGLATAFAAGITFKRATTPWSVLPDYDYWGNITGLITETGVNLNLASLFRHNNEHIVVIPKLIYLANYQLTSGSNIGLIVYSICAGAACAILLLLLARDLLHDRAERWALCGLLFPLAMFGAKLSHSYYFGMSGAIWLTADLFVILSAAALAAALRTQSIAWLLASLLAGLLGVLTYSTAIYALLVLFIVCGAMLALPKLRGTIPSLALVGIMLVIAAVVTVWLAYRSHPAGHPPLDFDPIGLAIFVLIYMGSIVSNGLVQPFVGLVILAAGLLSIRKLLTEQPGANIVLWVILLFFAPFNGLMTGIGRLGYGVQAAESSRYQSLAAISLMAAIVLVLAALPKDNSSRRVIWTKVLVMVALVAMAAFLAVNDRGRKFYANRLTKKPVAEIALRQNIAGDRHLSAGTPAIETLYRLLPALRATHHVPFNTQPPCEDFTGRPMAGASGAAAGAIESMTTYTVSHETRTAIELAGWAVHAGKPAACIVVVDGNGVVIGTGVTTRNQPDPLTQKPARIGWQAVATAPQSLPVCAFALFPGTAAWVPLANCQM